MTDFSSNLIDWYKINGRTLVWRTFDQAPDPYHVWLSEIMLQQTTVAAVKNYFETFTRLWPTVQNMAASPVEDILKEWAGLGYYARARNLHKCACVIVCDHSGMFPNTEKLLKALPGIGAYTAAAITAIAFGKRAVVVDGNIERIITRQNRVKVPLPKSKKHITALTDAVTPSETAPDFTKRHFCQAMMDLGALICTPKNPKCDQCPVHLSCKAFKAGDMEKYPIKMPKTKRPTRRAISFIILHDQHILLERRPAKGLLGGMLGVFHTPWTDQHDFPYATMADCAPVKTTWQMCEGQTQHTFTHFHLLTELAIGHLDHKINIENSVWVPLTDISKAGLPTVFKKMVTLYQSKIIQ